MAMVSEGLLSIDQYNKPMVLKDADAIAILLLRLLVMTPGTNYLHPEMGVNMRARYRYCSEDDMEDLNQEIITQINTYLPSYSTSSVNCEYQDGNIRVSINVDDTVFNYATGGIDSSENVISLMND